MEKFEYQFKEIHTAISDMMMKKQMLDILHKENIPKETDLKIKKDFVNKIESIFKEKE